MTHAQIHHRDIGIFKFEYPDLDIPKPRYVIETLHYGKVVKTGFEMVNFDKLFLCQFSTKMNQILMDGV